MGRDLLSSSDGLLIERRDAVLIVSIHDPPYNRMSLAFMDALEELVEALAHDDGIRAVVVTGAGDRNFSVGMDLKELPRGVQEKGGVDELFDQRLNVLSAIETMGKPWVATLFGYCLGGGLELPLACHFRLAAEEGAQIGLPELHLGTVPAWGGSARLARRVGRDRAIDLILRAKTISGPEALRIGLVHEVWPNAELKAHAIALAQELASMPRLAVKSMLQCLVGSETKTLAESLHEERRAVHETFGTPDQVEGMRAFLEKRQPVFNRS
jgi:enoyl-CoA hydratase/carnithine racemase